MRSWPYTKRLQCQRCGTSSRQVSLTEAIISARYRSWSLVTVKTSHVDNAQPVQWQMHAARQRDRARGTAAVRMRNNASSSGSTSCESQLRRLDDRQLSAEITSAAHPAVASATVAVLPQPPVPPDGLIQRQRPEVPSKRPD